MGDGHKQVRCEGKKKGTIVGENHPTSARNHGRGVTKATKMLEDPSESRDFDMTVQGWPVRADSRQELPKRWSGSSITNPAPRA